MTKHSIIRFAVDSNFLGWLAYASLCTKKEFFYAIRTSEEKYNGLVWIDKMIKAGRIELVIPHTVFHELIKRKPLTLTMQKKMTAEQIVNFNSNQHFKKITRKYIKHTPSIKLAYMNNRFIGDYIKRVEQIANLYSEPSSNSTNLQELKHNQTKPFLMNGKYLSNDARIMAEATLLGLNFLTFDQHFLKEEPINIANLIKQINQKEFNSTAAPISFLNLIDSIKREHNDAPYLNKHFRFEPLPQLVNYCLLNHNDYSKTVRHQIQIKNQYNHELSDLVEKRTLFLKFLETPLDLNNLIKDTQITPSHSYDTLQKSTSQPKTQKLKTKTTLAPPTQQSSKPKIKIQFDLNSANANDILEEFFKQTRKQNITSMQSQENIQAK